MLIYTHQRSKKKKKLNAKQRELQADWEKLLKKYEPKKPLKPVAAKTLVVNKPFVRETPHYPSLNSGHHDTAAKPKQTYTGSKMIGIGTLHKSNAVPIFSEDDAKEQARMRRG